MELTQRLECTQEFYPTQSEKEFPDQIGYLGICGTKYPVRKGPNKIGRDPETCNIVLNLNSISRQHAVINILNNREFMLMDLDSANKTKLSNKTLQAYIPHPLKNGDMVQFGHVFGVFRLIEEESDLPMTQALDVPDTPVQNRHVSKMTHVTTVPESPDVSDKDDSFIVPSQPKPKNVFKSPSNNFIKSSGKTISIKPIGLNKIDNVYWSSSKKSDSFSLHSNSSINDSSVTEKDTTMEQNIHEMETQPCNSNESKDGIYDAETQCFNPTPSIYNMETQLPTDLPEVCKIQDQQNLHINFTTDNKENDNNIYNAETQFILDVNETTDKSENGINNIPNELKNDSKGKLDTSNDIIIFDEIDQAFDDNFESQPLLSSQTDLPCNNKIEEARNDNHEVSNDIQSQEIGYKNKCSKRARIASYNSDGDDIEILLSQKGNAVVDDDVTDCEDDVIAKIENPKNAIDDDITDCEDNFDDVIEPNKAKIDASLENKAIKSNSKKVIPLEDVLTQVIEEVPGPSKAADITSFEDLPTQIIEEDVDKPIGFDEALTQKICPQETTPFKMPKISPRSTKKKSSELNIIKQIVNNDVSIDDDDDEKYYAATQQIFNDLCTQRELSPEVILPINKAKNTKNNAAAENVSIAVESGDDSDMEEKINNFVTRLSKSQIIGVVGDQNRTSSNSTPKTTSTVSLFNTETETGSRLHNNDIETEKNHNKRKLLITKIDLMKEVETLPTRVMTRVRKPTRKMQNCDESAKDLCDKILNNKNGPQSTGINVDNINSKSENVKTNKSKSEGSRSTNKHIKEKSTIKDKGNDDKKKSDNQTRRSKKTKDRKEPKSKESGNGNKDILYYLNKESPRRTRSRSKQKAEDDKKEKETAEKSKDKKQSEQHKEPSPEVNKRNTRQNTQKSNESKLSLESNETKSRESSTVYNISGSNESNKFKRPASGGEHPKAKKSKSDTNDVSVRSTPSRRIKTHYVLFTAFPCDEVKAKLEKLGAVIVTDVTQCTVVLTMQVKRTFKLLCAVGLGKPIVGPMWVQACVDTNIVVDPWLYLIKDEVTERRFQFNLARSLAARRGFLKGYNISSTPNVLPNAQEMKLIVECSGGTWKEGGSNWICVSAVADKALWPTLKQKGAVIVSTEFILAGVLRQRVEIDINRLA